jgi:hypothetical protein
MGGLNRVKNKGRDNDPLFLGGGALLGGGLGSRCSLGDSARLGLADDLGLLNDRRSGSGRGLAGLTGVGLGLGSSGLLGGGSLLSRSGLGGGSGSLGGGGLLGTRRSSLLGGSGLSSRLLGSGGLLSSRLSGGLGSRLLLGQLHRTRGTLGLSELALLNTSLDGLVELSVESGLRRDVDLVVRRHILLNGLTAGTIALFQVDNGILDHITVGSVGRGGGLLSHAGCFLGRHGGR